MSKKIIPMSGYVLVRDQVEDKLESGVFIAEDKDKVATHIGEVIELPKSKEPININLRKYIRLTVQDIRNDQIFKSIKKGSMVVYKRYSGNEVELEGVEYKLVGFADITAVLK